MKCPCYSGKEYESCCKPFHDGALPTTPLELMRSRFSAYALGLSNYIMTTTHPNCPEHRTDTKAWEQAILSFSKTTKFEGLTIIDATNSHVTFTAHLSQEGEDLSFTEKSYFEKVDGKWLYKSGEIS